MFKHILFPTDFSETAAASFPAAVAMAKCSGAKLTLINVWHVPAVYYSSIDPVGQLMIDYPDLLEQASNRLEALAATADTAGSPIMIEKTVIEGEPAPALVAWAEEKGVDLIMMGTHGHGAFRNLLLGSVTAKVLHDSACAVWTAAHSRGENPAGQGPYKRMLCATSGSPRDEELLRGADALAREYGAELRLVHAIPAPPAQVERGVGQEFEMYLSDSLREEIAGLQRRAGLNLPLCIRAGSVSEAVREVALQNQTDLVVIGRGTIHDTLGRLRTNTYAIIRDAPCPVLSLPLA
jgi:nucleotide-binding universal stress UspA family protein